MAEQPIPEGTPVASADLRRMRTELADAAIATRRAVERFRLARIILAAAVQIIIAVVAWRIWVWRSRRRR